jgi:acetoacetate decarboxylase
MEMVETMELNSPGKVLKNLLHSFSRRGENLWDNARFVLADVPVDGLRVKKILPLGLWPSDPPRATLLIVDYTQCSFTAPYHEAAMLVHVRSPLGFGRHCCWMTVDDDTALIYGRELLGYPKKMARFAFEETDGGIRAAVTRRGVEVLAMEAARGQAQSAPAPVFDFKTFLAGSMGQFFILSPLWLFRPREVIHESYAAEVKLTIAASDFDPISSLVTGGPTNGRIVVLDIPGSKYNLPVGVTGLGWFANTFYLRFR